MRAGTAGNTQAAQAAAERAQREAAERARREAAERAQREAAERAQREAAERAQREAATQNQTNVTNGNPNNSAFNRGVGENGTNNNPRNILEVFSERTGIDANFPKQNFTSKFGKNNSPADNSPQAELRSDNAAKPKPSDKNEADGNRNNFVEQAKNGVRSFFEKARDVYKNATENIDKDSFAGKALKAFEEIPTEKKIALAVAFVTGGLGKPEPPAERILAASRDGDSTTATRTLREEIENIKGANAPEKRAELINNPKVKEALGNIGRDLLMRDDDNSLSDEELKSQVVEIHDSFSDLSRAAEIAGSDGARTIAESFVRDVAAIEPHAENIDQFSPVAATSLASTMLQEVIEGGDGASFAVNLTFAFKRAGNEYIAANLTENINESLTTVRENFADASKKTGELNGKLALLLGGFSPTLSAKEQQQAIDSFKQQHAPEYSDFEEKGRILASTLDGANAIINLPQDCDEANAESVSALQGEAKEILKNLPRIGQTEIGQKAIADALEKQAAGKSTFMDLVPGIAQQTNDAAKYMGDIANLTTKAVGARVVQLAADGRERDAAKLFLGLKKNHQLFGIGETAMNGIAGDMRRVMTSPAGSPEKLAAQESLEGRFRKVGGGTPGLEPNGRASQSLRGLGLVVSIAGTADSWTKFEKQNPAEKIRTLGNSLGVGVDGGTLALEILGKDKSVTANLFRRAAVPLGGVGVVLDGINAIDNFKNGNYAEGVLSSASAAGGAILAVAGAYSLAGAAQVVPLWGQIAGGVLVVGATVGNIALGKHYEHQDEDDAKAFLQGAGLSEPAADALSDLTSDRENVGQFITQVAPYLGVTPDELLQHLATLDEDALDDIVKMSHDLKSNDAQEYEATADNDDEVGEKNEGFLILPDSEEMPESLYGAARWMTKHGYSPYKTELPPPNQGDFEPLLHPPYA